jgi:hypothetical protein
MRRMMMRGHPFGAAIGERLFGRSWSMPRLSK